MLEIILATLLQWNTLNKNIEETDGTQLSTYILPRSSDSSRHIFTLGDSRFQRAEKDRKEEEIRLAAQTNQQGSSYTGRGEAIKLYKDTKYKNCVEFAKAQTGIYRQIGAGGRAGINSYEPQVGAIGVERGRFPHAVVIILVSDVDITVVESNWLVDEDETHWISQRVLKRSDFIGFII